MRFTGFIIVIGNYAVQLYWHWLLP